MRFHCMPLLLTGLVPSATAFSHGHARVSKSATASTSLLMQSNNGEEDRSINSYFGTPSIPSVQQQQQQSPTFPPVNGASAPPQPLDDDDTVSKQLQDYLEYASPETSGNSGTFDQQAVDNAVLDMPGLEIDAAEVFENLSTTLNSSWRIFQEAQTSGYDWKIGKLMILAGEYDIAATKAKVDTLIQSAGCVMFVSPQKNNILSPSCNQAIKAMEVAGADVTYVTVDNPLHAELAKKVGRTSLPAIFIGGQYVGGFDEEVSEQTPGIFALAFQGKLRPMLEAAGALR